MYKPHIEKLLLIAQDTTMRQELAIKQPIRLNPAYDKFVKVTLIGDQELESRAY